MKINEPPCKQDCARRTISPNCHMTCEAYLGWRRAYDAVRQAIKDANESEKPSPEMFKYKARKARKKR